MLISDNITFQSHNGHIFKVIKSCECCNFKGFSWNESTLFHFSGMGDQNWVKIGTPIVVEWPHRPFKLWILCCYNIFRCTYFQNLQYALLLLVLNTVGAPLKAAACILFTPYLKTISLFSMKFFQKILFLCMASIQEWLMMARIR